MVNVIAGALALATLVVLLSLYLARIPSVAFWLVTVVVVALAIADFVKTVRAEKAFRDNGGQGGGAGDEPSGG